jgi:hypothetical protein
MPLVSPGREEVVMDNPAAMLIDNALVAVAPAASVTRTVKLDVPEDDGVPLITPPPLEIGPNPAGSAPADNDQVNGAVPPAATTVWEYAAPTVPPGNDEVVMLIAEATTIESALVVVAPTESVTRTVKLEVPEADGVPLMAPPLVMGFIPVGSAPDAKDQVSGPVPPVAATVWE